MSVSDPVGSRLARPARVAPRGVIFAVVSVALFMASVDATIVATALPTLHNALHTSINWAGWTITAYQLGQTVAMPVAGRISDQYGRKRVFVICVGVFTLTSLACGLSTSIYMLVPLRLLQAMGGGAFMPSATGIISDHFGEDRDRAIGFFTSIFPLGGLVGPVLGGLIIQFWSWRGIFLINVPIGALLAVLAIALLPSSERRPSAHTDILGVLLLGGVILSAMYTITTLGDGHTTAWSPNFLVPLAVFGVMTNRFVHRARTASVPIIPLRLLRGKGFLLMNFINLVFGSCAIGFGAMIPLYAQDRYHIAALQSGTLLSARAVGMISVAAMAAMLLRRTGYRLPMVIGFTLISTGILLTAVHPLAFSPYAWLALGAGVTGVGFGIGAPASNNATLALAPDDIAAIAGLRGMFRQAGAIIGVSITTALVARSHDPGASMSHTFAILAVLLLLILPLVLTVPEHRGRW